MVVAVSPPHGEFPWLSDGNDGSRSGDGSRRSLFYRGTRTEELEMSNNTERGAQGVGRGVVGCRTASARRSPDGSCRITRRRLAALGWRVPTRYGLLFGKAPLPGAGYRCSASRPPLTCSHKTHRPCRSSFRANLSIGWIFLYAIKRAIVNRKGPVCVFRPTRHHAPLKAASNRRHNSSGSSSPTEIRIRYRETPQDSAQSSSP